MHSYILHACVYEITKHIPKTLVKYKTSFILISCLRWDWRIRRTFSIFK